MANLSDLVGFALTVTIHYKKSPYKKSPIWAIWWVLRWLLLCVIRSLLLITYSNTQRKTHQIAQIRHVEPKKRQHTTIEVGLHLFWAITWPFLDISLRYKTLQYSFKHFFTFQTNNQTRRLCGHPVDIRAYCRAKWRLLFTYTTFWETSIKRPVGSFPRVTMKHSKIHKNNDLFILNNNKRVAQILFTNVGQIMTWLSTLSCNWTVQTLKSAKMRSEQQAYTSLVNGKWNQALSRSTACSRL